MGRGSGSATRRAGRALRAGALALLGTWLLAAAPAHAAGQGLELTGTKQLDGRLSELTFTTPALTTETHVRVLLPDGYDASGNTRYPVLYLLHGAIDDYQSWTTKGDAEKITAGVPLIVVMPDAGQYGAYTNWYNDGGFGPPEWETYHVHQLLPWIDAHFPTIAARRGRAIAGLSMGGGGAMHYAARYPGLFVAAASFSGAVDSNNAEIQPVTQASGLADGSHTPGAISGLRATDEVRWRASNPWDLAENLAGMFLTVRTGNGMPGGPGGDTGDPVEANVHEESTSFHSQLLSLGIPHVWDDYGAGGHAWYYWQRDLKETLPAIMQTFAHPSAPPSPFNFTTADPAYDVYGWHVAMDRPALEFSELRDAGEHGFEIRGSGSASVTTAGLFRPGATVRAVIRSGTGTVTRALRADRDGRIGVDLTLGPGNPYQQYSPQAQATGSTVYRARVDLSGPARGRVHAKR